MFLSRSNECLVSNLPLVQITLALNEKCWGADLSIFVTLPINLFLILAKALTINIYEPINTANLRENKIHSYFKKFLPTTLLASILSKRWSKTYLSSEKAFA